MGQPPTHRPSFLDYDDINTSLLVPELGIIKYLDSIPSFIPLKSNNRSIKVFYKMEIFKDMAARHPRGSVGGGNDIRVSFTKDGVGVGTDSTALGEMKPFVPAKNVNFSLFLRPAIAKDTGGRGGLIQKVADVTKEAGTTGQTSDPDGKVVPKFPNVEAKNISRDAGPCPDEQLLGPFSTLASTMEEKRTRCQGQTCDLQVPALSACSQGASNNPRVTLKRRYEDCESSSQSDSDSEDSWRMGRSSPTKGSWSSAHNSSSERVRKRRRGRVNKKLRALQELLPNCDEVDQVAVLDEAIEYLKRLQQQFLFQVLSTRSSMYMSPSMMLPAAIQQMYTPYLNQFPAVNVPRGMNTQAAVGCNELQFPISHDPRTTVLVGNTMRMLGLQSIACIPPFVPSFGQSSTSSLSTQAPSTDTVNLLNAAVQSGSRH